MGQPYQEEMIPSRTCTLDVDGIHDGDFEFGRSFTLFSHDDYHFQDLETSCGLEIGGIRETQWKAIGIGLPTVWLH